MHLRVKINWGVVPSWAARNLPTHFLLIPRFSGAKTFSILKLLITSFIKKSHMQKKKKKKKKFDRLWLGSSQLNLTLKPYVVPKKLKLTGPPLRECFFKSFYFLLLSSKNITIINGSIHLHLVKVNCFSFVQKFIDSHHFCKPMTP